MKTARNKLPRRQSNPLQALAGQRNWALKIFSAMNGQLLYMDRQWRLPRETIRSAKTSVALLEAAVDHAWKCQRAHALRKQRNGR